MDPDETLKQIRATISSLKNVETNQSVDELIELVEVLDDWMVKGGFLPIDWENNDK